MKVAELFEQNDWEDDPYPPGEEKILTQMHNAELQLDLAIRRVKQLEKYKILTAERSRQGGSHMGFTIPAGVANHDKIELWYHVEAGPIGHKRMDALMKLQERIQNVWNLYQTLTRELEKVRHNARS